MKYKTQFVHALHIIIFILKLYKIISDGRTWHRFQTGNPIPVRNVMANECQQSEFVSSGSIRTE
jgi:hypothetical protein